MTISNEEPSAMFSKAMRMRDGNDYEGAISVLQSILSKLTPDDKKLRVHSLHQLAHLYYRQEEFIVSEQHYREAIELAPRFELASLGLFHALVKQDRWNDALHEIIRFVTLRDSTEYRDLLNDEFLSGLLPNTRALAAEARTMLERWC